LPCYLFFRPGICFVEQKKVYYYESEMPPIQTSQVVTGFVSHSVKDTPAFMVRLLTPSYLPPSFLFLLFFLHTVNTNFTNFAAIT
jgi:hypothetical protein